LSFQKLQQEWLECLLLLRRQVLKTPNLAEAVGRATGAEEALVQLPIRGEVVMRARRSMAVPAMIPQAWERDARATPSELGRTSAQAPN